MSKKFPILLLAASVLLPVLSFGQVEIQLRVGRRPGWDRINVKANARFVCGLIIAQR